MSAFRCRAFPLCGAAAVSRLECPGPAAKGGAAGLVRMLELPSWAARCSGGQPKGRLVPTLAEAAGMAPSVGLRSAVEASLSASGCSCSTAAWLPREPACMRDLFQALSRL